MEARTARVLIVEDEANIRKGMRDVLARDGHMVNDAGTGEEGLAFLHSWECDVAIIDIRMPGMSGMETLEAIRAQWPDVAVIILTGHGTLETAIAALRAGAYDYLLKPARPDEIRRVVDEAMAVARRRQEEARFLETIRAGLRRLEEPARSESEGITPPFGAPGVRIGELQINPRAHEVHQQGKRVDLSLSEYKLLVALAARPGEVIDYTTLVRLSLGYEAEPWEAKELIKRHIYSMRQKIEPDPSCPQYVHNVRGVGYRLAPPPLEEG